MASREVFREALALSARLFLQRAFVSCRAEITNISKLAQTEEVLELFHVPVVQFVTTVIRVEDPLKVLFELLGAAFELNFFYVAVNWTFRESRNLP